MQTASAFQDFIFFLIRLIRIILIKINYLSEKSFYYFYFRILFTFQIILLQKILQQNHETPLYIDVVIVLTQDICFDMG